MRWASTASNATELPFISITAEAWRGFTEVGKALADVAESTHVPDSGTHAKLLNVSQRLLTIAPVLLHDLRRSMATDVIATNVSGGPRCFPYVAGIRECGELPPSVPTSRASEPWRTYAEAFYSGALEAPVISEILAWHQTQSGSGVRGSRLKLGVVSGAGNTVANGDQFETFTMHGFGYGLLTADLVEPFLLQYYAISAHGYTRGTWIAPESTPVDRDAEAPPFCAPAGLTAPLLLKWMLLFEAPLDHTLWLGKATPRSWLEAGEHMAITNATTGSGRISFRYDSSLDVDSVVRVSIYWVPTSLPPGGLRIRVRVPRGTDKMRHVEVGGQAWSSFNVTEETVAFSERDLVEGGADLLARLSNVTIFYA